MPTPHLVHMANQIGQFFEAMPERPQALEELALHLKQFWAPSMRQSLLAHWDSGHLPHLAPIVVEALTQHRDRLSMSATSVHRPPHA
jgi:formate dehydrogenase subunit delta